MELNLPLQVGEGNDNCGKLYMTFSINSCDQLTNQVLIHECFPSLTKFSPCI